MSDAAALFARAFGLAREHFTLFFTAVVVTTVLGAATDLAPEGALWPLTILSGLVSLYFQALLNAAVLELDPIGMASRRFVSLIGLAILFNVGLWLGILLAIIPGLVLLTRWIVAVPVLLAEERGAYESLRRSWELTRRRWGLALAVAAIFPLALGPLIVFQSLTAYPAMPMALVVAVNLYAYLLIAYQWLLGAALYRQVRGDVPDRSLPEIFS